MDDSSLRRDEAATRRSRWNLAIIALLFLAWFLLRMGCGPCPLVGRWQTTMFGISTAEYVFTGDGRFFKQVYAAGILVGESRGKYEIANGTIIYHADSGDIGLGIEFNPETVNQPQKIIRCTRRTLVLENMVTGVHVTLNRL